MSRDGIDEFELYFPLLLYNDCKRACISFVADFERKIFLPTTIYISCLRQTSGTKLFIFRPKPAIKYMLVSRLHFYLESNKSFKIIILLPFFS